MLELSIKSSIVIRPDLGSNIQQMFCYMGLV